MRITYDPKYDVLYLKLGEAEKVLSKEMDEDITMDLDSEGKMVGIEILSASEHMNLSTLLPVEIKKQALR
jgi:uncharacterized protein YuzE